MHNVTRLDAQLYASTFDSQGTGEIDAVLDVSAPDGATKSGQGMVFGCTSTGLFGNCVDRDNDVVTVIEDWEQENVALSRTVDAVDREDAERKVSERFHHTGWTGTWNGTVTLESEIEYDTLRVNVRFQFLHYTARVY